MKIINYGSELIDPNLFIPEEVLLEIFQYLPFDSIYKFMCVSKIWYSLLSKTVRRSCTTNYGFYDGDLAVASPKLNTSRFLYNGGFSLKYIHSKEFKFSSILRLLGSSEGLVLLTARERHTGDDVYYVCNPLTRKLSPLPKPFPERYIYRSESRFLYGFVCQSSSSSSASSPSTSTGVSYTAVRIEEFDNTSSEYEDLNKNLPTKFKIHVFSSDSGEWSEYEVSSPPEVTWSTDWYDFGRKRTKYDHRKGKRYNEYERFCYGNLVITHNKILYWLEGEFRNKIMSYDMIQNSQKDVRHRQCKLIELPKERDEEDFEYQCLGESEELLRYCQIQRKKMTLCIWYYNPSARTSVWELGHKIELKNMCAGRDNNSWFNDSISPDTAIYPIAFNPDDRHVVLLEYLYSPTTRYILGLDVRSNKFDLLGLPPEEDYAFHWLVSDVTLVITPKATKIPRLPPPLSSSRKSKSRT